MSSPAQSQGGDCISVITYSINHEFFMSVKYGAILDPERIFTPYQLQNPAERETESKCQKSSFIATDTVSLEKQNQTSE